MTGLRVVLVEDNADLVDDCAYHLRRAGLDVMVCGDGRGLDCVLAGAGSGGVDVVVLDIGLPGEDGFSIAARLREFRPDIGIVMLTARGQTADRVRGYQIGADNYLCKPVDMKELIVVVQASARAHNASQSLRMQCWQIDTGHWQLLTPDGAGVVSLTASELTLLRVLASSSGQEAERSRIIAELHSDVSEYDERRLEQLVSRLRRKIDTVFDGPSVLRSVRGKGYAFLEPLRCV